MNVNRVQNIPDKISIRNAIVTTADKSGLSDLANGMMEIIPDLKIYSTGGTYSFLKNNLGTGYQNKIIPISEYTGQPEMQGGLVKTLDFKIYIGLLNEPFNAFHNSDLERQHAVSFDLVVVNLYPFEEIIKRKESTPEDARSFIDIGGPCMLRAASKNFLRVVTLCDPDDYPDFLELLRKGQGKIPFETRFALAKKAFNLTAAYDNAIAMFLRDLPAEQCREHYNFVE